MTRTLVIANPRAGNADQRQGLVKGITAWRKAGWRVTLQETRGPGDATERARKAASSYDVIVAAGGDGTVNEVVNGLAHQHHAALGAIPLGTGNVWVRELHQSLKPEQAALQLLDAERAIVDLGQANQRFFLLMAGIGFDAAITAAVQATDKHRLGRMAYIVRSLPILWKIRGTRTRVAIDGTPLKGNALFVLVSNSRRYGGVIDIAYRATITDGLLDVCVMLGDSALATPHLLAGVLLRGHGVVPGLQYFQAREVDIACSRSQPVQVDGDYIGTTPQSIRSAPKALTVLLPPTINPSDLLLPPSPRWSWKR